MEAACRRRRRRHQEVQALSRARRIVLVLVAALATASTAAADGAAPTVTLLSPANGTTLTLDGKHDAAFSWRIDFAQAQTTPTAVTFTVSADPTFQGPHYTESRSCDPSSPACFTSTTLKGTSWINAATGSTALPSRTMTLYWHVSVDWQSGQTPVNSANGLLTGAPGIDKTPPRIAVKKTTVKRGSRARVAFQLADDSGTVTAKAQLLYHGKQLLSSTKTFTDVDWANVYVFWFDVPRTGVPTGRYSACVRGTDMHGNTARRCATLTIR
jgi:hypothetical protein